MSILEVRNLRKVYTTRFGGNKVEALSNVNFSVSQGEYVAIMGNNGLTGCNGSGDFGVYVQKTIHVHTITSIFSFIRASNASSVSASLMVSVPSMEMEEAAEPAMVDLLRSLP